MTEERRIIETLGAKELIDWWILFGELPPGVGPVQALTVDMWIRAVSLERGRTQDRRIGARRSDVVKVA